MSENAKRVQSVLSTLGRMLPDLESVYKDIHSHPELSMQENRTAGIAADRLRAAGYEVTTRVGQTEVVGNVRTDVAEAAGKSLYLSSGRTKRRERRKVVCSPDCVSC